MIRFGQDRIGGRATGRASRAGSGAGCRRLVAALLTGLVALTGVWVAGSERAHAVEPYFCIELVLSRNWPAAKFYCDAAATPDNTGIVLAEGIAYFFGGSNVADIAHAARLWRSVPPIADASEWRNISDVFDPEINIIERKAANLDRLAQYQLGVLHETGHFETPDLAAAMFRYEQAAQANLPEAHIALARLYQKGVDSIAVAADPVAAEQHLLAAIALRTPSQRRVPDEVPQAVPDEAIADASETGVTTTRTADTEEPEAVAVPATEVAEATGSGESAEIVGSEAAGSEAIGSELGAAGEAVTDGVPVPPEAVEPVVAAQAEHVGVQQTTAAEAVTPSLGATPTGALPSDSRAAADVELAPEVLAALLAAVDSAGGESDSSGSGHVSASSQPVVDGALETAATPDVVEAAPAVAGDPSAEQPSNVTVITIVPRGATTQRPLPDTESTVELAPRLGSLGGAAETAETVPEPAVAPALPVETAAGDATDETVDIAAVEQPVVEYVMPSAEGAVGGVRAGVDARQGVLPSEQLADEAVADPQAEPSAEPAIPEIEDADVAAVPQSGGEIAEGEPGWTPPAEVAALYYPRESLDGETASPAEAPATGDETAAAGSSVASGRLVTTEPLETSSLSCADAGSGVTLAMPVIPDDEETSGDQSPSSAPHAVDPADLATIEAGIRAKAAGDADGALAAWEPLARGGNATAQYLVGLLYVTGDAIPRNLRAGYAWLSLATAQGHQLATCELWRLEQRMSPEDVALARQQAEVLAGAP